MKLSWCTTAKKRPFTPCDGENFGTAILKTLRLCLWIRATKSRRTGGSEASQVRLKVVHNSSRCAYIFAGRERCGSELQIGRQRLCGEAGGFSCVCQRHPVAGTVLGRDQRAAGKREQKIVTAPLSVNIQAIGSEAAPLCTPIQRLRATKLTLREP